MKSTTSNRYEAPAARVALLYRLLADYSGRRTLLVADRSEAEELLDRIGCSRGDRVDVITPDFLARPIKEAHVAASAVRQFEVVLLHRVFGMGQLARGLDEAELSTLVSEAMRRIQPGGLLAGIAGSRPGQPIFARAARPTISPVVCREILQKEGFEDVQVFFVAPSVDSPFSLVSAERETLSRFLREDLARSRQHMRQLRYVVEWLHVVSGAALRSFTAVAFCGRRQC